jgi:hypothetical protein
VKRAGVWFAASANGWRPVDSAAALKLDEVLGDGRFWSEPAYIPPCPDYGASLLLVKVPGKAAATKKSTCTSVADKAVFAALGA